MARPENQGLKYFPFDVGFFGDKKIRLLRGDCGAAGIEIYQRLLCKIYEDNGYYLTWDDSEAGEDCALLADDTGYSKNEIRLAVSSCIRRSLFDNTLFNVGKVLTSRSIQRRYFSAIRDTRIKAAAQGRHTYIPKDLCLLTESDFFELNKTQGWLKVAHNQGYSGNNSDYSENNPDKSPINPAKKSKVKKSKENIRDMRPTPPDAAPAKTVKTFTPPDIAEVRAYCSERNNGIDAQYFCDYYEARGWRFASGDYVVDWKAAIRSTWEKIQKNTAVNADKPRPARKSRFHNYESRTYSAAQMDELGRLELERLKRELYGKEDGLS